MTLSLVRVDLLLSPYLRRWFVLSPAVTCPCTAFDGAPRARMLQEVFSPVRASPLNRN